jgi:tetratricopeptide (TPR) repeat protein
MNGNNNGNESTVVKDAHRAVDAAQSEEAAARQAAAKVESAAVADAAAVAGAIAARQSAATVATAAVVEAAAAREAASFRTAVSNVESASVVESAAVFRAAAEVEASAMLLNRLLKMADGYQAANALHQAAEMYFELVDRHPDTLEAVQARKCLIGLGENYERKGELRQARSIFERLLETVPA